MPRIALDGAGPSTRHSSTSRLHRSTDWVILNTHRAPFNNEHARRALAFALDRGRWSRMWAGRIQADSRRVSFSRPASPGTTVLPVYCRPRYEPLERARLGGRGRSSSVRNARRARPRHHRPTRLRLGPAGPRGRGDPSQARLPRRRQALRPRRVLRRVLHDSRHVDAFGTAGSGLSRAVELLRRAQLPRLPLHVQQGLRRRLARAAAAATAADRTIPGRSSTGRSRAPGSWPYLNLKAIDFGSKRVGNYQHHPSSAC